MTPSVPDKRAALLRELSKEATNGTSSRLLSAVQVALLFGVSEPTIRVWANKNWIPAIRTPSGHWKFPALEITHVYEMGFQGGQVLSWGRPKSAGPLNEVLLIDE